MTDQTPVEEPAAARIDQPPAPAICKQCRETMAFGARLCRKCGSYQDVRGYLSLSSTVLSLLLALIALLSATGSKWWDAVRPRHSRLTISSLFIRGDEFDVIASNLGEAPGVVRKAMIIPGTLYPQIPAGVSESSKSFVPPGSQQVTFLADLHMSAKEAKDISGKLFARFHDDNAQIGSIDVYVADNTGRQHITHFNLWGLNFVKILNSHMHRCLNLKIAPTYENGCAAEQ